MDDQELGSYRFTVNLDFGTDDKELNVVLLCLLFTQSCMQQTHAQTFAPRSESVLHKKYLYILTVIH